MCESCRYSILEKFSKNLMKKNKGPILKVSVPKSVQTKILQTYSKSKNEYSSSMQDALADFVSGKISKADFLSRQKAAIKKAYSEAFTLGKQFNLGANATLTSDERKTIAFLASEEMKFMANFANDIGNSAGRMPYGRRLQMYIDGLDGVFGFGRIAFLPDEIKIIWKLGVTDKHCLDCLSYVANNPYTKKTLPGVPKSGNSRCFVGSSNWYKALTPDGWKKIHKIKIGDFVLSHRGKWRQVTGIIKTPTNDEYCYEVVLESESTRPLKFYMLDDHLSISDGKWTRADELNVGDRLLMVGHRCKHCGKLIHYDDPRAIDFRFCSIECGNKHDKDRWAKGRAKLIARDGTLFRGHYRKIKSIKRVRVDSLVARTTLSLTVDGDESYVTNGGLIAHNCLSNCLCSLDYYLGPNKSTSEYENFIISKSIGPRVPTEAEYANLMSIRDDYYYNTLMFERTGDVKFKETADAAFSQYNSYQKKNGILINDSLPVSQMLTDFRNMNQNKHFEFIDPKSMKSIDSNSFVGIFTGDHFQYGHVKDVVNNHLKIRVFGGEDVLLEIGRSIAFKEKS